jgi:transcriptional regulator with XRE-family HTH domain
MANDICVRLGRRIRLLRTERGWTQQQLADMAQLGRVHISELENGKREAGLRALERLADSFDISLETFIAKL